jgi:5'-nucleotidase
MKNKTNTTFFAKALGILFFGLFLSISFAFPKGLKEKSGNLTIVFMNDTHNHLLPFKDMDDSREYGGAARWATIIKNIRKEAGEILFLHAGDMVVGSAGTYLLNGRPDWERLPLYGYRGLVEIPLFAKLGLDAISPGNHEFDYGFYWNYRLFKQAPFDVLTANITAIPTPAAVSYEPLQYKPYQIYKKGKFRIGVIGLLTNSAILTSQIKVNDPVEILTPLVEKLKNECDIVVVLSHLGYGADKSLASEISGIDVIVGGHSHTILPEPTVINGTIITQTGSFGESIGRLDLEYKKGALNNYRYQLIPADYTVTEDTEIKAWLDKRRYPITLEHSLSQYGEEDASLGAYLTKVVANKFPCDAVLIKTGNYNNEMPAGKVSAEDFFTALWPYRKRSLAPDKELSPEQVMDIVSGKALLPPDSTAEALLDNVGLTTLISAEVPVSVLERAEALTFNGDLFFRRFSSVNTRKKTCKLIMDLQSWIELYREGILTDNYKYQNLQNEVFEVLLGNLK